MDVFIATVRRLSVGFGVLSVALLLAAVVVVCQLVFVRYVLNASAVWQHEFVTFSLIASTFLGSPYVLLTRGHVYVDLLPEALGGRGRYALALIASLLSFGFCVLVAWRGVLWWHEAWAGGWRADTVWAPSLWVPYLSMPVGMGLVALQYVADIAALCTGRAPPFGAPGDASE